MPRVLDLPNVEAAVNMALHADDIRACSSIPKKNPIFPLIVTMRLGGRPADKRALDAPRIQLEAWGAGAGEDAGETDKSTVLNYGRDAWKSLLEAEGETIELSDGERVFISAVEPEIGLQWLPDPATGRPRYVASLRVFARQSVRATS